MFSSIICSHHLLLRFSLCSTSDLWLVLKMLLGSFSFLLLDRAKPLPSLSSSAPIFNPVKGFSAVRFSKRNVVVVKASNKEANNPPVLNVAFEPFEEVKKELLVIPTVPHDSLARQKYTDQCEAALNTQIKWANSHAFSFLPSTLFYMGFLFLSHTQ